MQWDDFVHTLNDQLKAEAPPAISGNQRIRLEHVLLICHSIQCDSKRTAIQANPGSKCPTPRRLLFLLSIKGHQVILNALEGYMDQHRSAFTMKVYGPTLLTLR